VGGRHNSLSQKNHMESSIGFLAMLKKGVFDKMEKETEQKINQLQLIEQSMQNILMQKQQLQLQISEMDAASEELEKTEEAYKIVGNILALAKKEDLKKELKEKREITEMRIKSLEKQEGQIKEKASKLQEEILKKIKK
jgi:prefoldin beta subunit